MVMTALQGQIDMSSPEELIKFINMSVATSPADEYSLIYSGHGDSW